MTAAIQPFRVAIDATTSSYLGIDRSTTTSAVSQTLMAARPGRAYLIIKNDTVVDQYINLGGPAVATPGGGNYKIAAGGFFDLRGYNGSIDIISSGVAAAISAREVNAVL